MVKFLYAYGESIYKHAYFQTKLIFNYLMVVKLLQLYGLVFQRMYPKEEMVWHRCHSSFILGFIIELSVSLAGIQIIAVHLIQLVY